MCGCGGRLSPGSGPQCHAAPWCTGLALAANRPPPQAHSSLGCLPQALCRARRNPAAAALRTTPRAARRDGLARDDPLYSSHPLHRPRPSPRPATALVVAPPVATPSLASLASSLRPSTRRARPLHSPCARYSHPPQCRSQRGCERRADTLETPCGQMPHSFAQLTGSWEAGNAPYTPIAPCRTAATERRRSRHRSPPLTALDGRRKVYE